MILENFFKTNHPFELWSDFEFSLARADYAYIIAKLYECWQNKNNNINIIEFEKWCKKVFIDIQKIIEDIFQDWIGLINISVQKKYNLSLEDHYITFNYTKTLESVYNISDKNVYHIHGKIGDKKLIFGHREDNQYFNNNNLLNLKLDFFQLNDNNAPKLKEISMEAFNSLKKMYMI